MGAVLEQQDSVDGKWKLVLYWNSKFWIYEQNYNVSEKSALAQVSAIKKLKKYLLGRTFVLETGHKALVTLLDQENNKKTASRLERWREQISFFSYTVVYRKGSDNVNSD